MRGADLAAATPASDRIFGSAWRVTGLYTLLAIATTWPLAPRLTRSLPLDQGDSLLNCWILSWGADHLLAWFWGSAGAFRDYWNPPIFHPAPLALAYSEHLFVQAIEIAPIYGLTQNIILCYNLLILSTFVLSALGAYLLVRELTGDPFAAWIAGACYGFALYRLPQLTHLQVVSSQWMPFVLYGLRRFFTSLRPDPLGWASAALVAQNLSCGYYLVFFAPFVALYCLYEIADRGLWRRWRMWISLAVAAIAVGLMTWPFVRPYLMLRELGFPARDVWEVQHYSADVLAFVTASDDSRLWGWLQAFPRFEGQLFPGLVAPFLACVAVVFTARRLAASTLTLRESRPGRRALIATLLAIASLYVLIALAVGLTADTNWTFGGLHLRLNEAWKAWVPATLLALAAAALSRRMRTFLRGVPGSALGFFVVLTFGACALATGPSVTVRGELSNLPAPYAQLYWHVPGFDGLRVPARYAMLGTLGLAVLAGFGAREIARRGPAGRRALAVLAVLFLVESTGAPIRIDHMNTDPGYAAPPRVRLGQDAPDVYRFAASLPAGAVLIEFPFGPGSWDQQYMFYQRVHHVPIVNGYSGGFPGWYQPMADAFSELASTPAHARSLLLGSGASHAIVHRRGYLTPSDADAVERFLVTSGARLVRVSADDRVYALPRSGQRDQG